MAWTAAVVQSDDTARGPCDQGFGGSSELRCSDHRRNSAASQKRTPRAAKTQRHSLHRRRLAERRADQPKHGSADSTRGTTTRRTDTGH
eukprot:4243495-Pyramimonas_sp.AAC.1